MRGKRICFWRETKQKGKLVQCGQILTKLIRELFLQFDEYLDPPIQITLKGVIRLKESLKTQIWKFNPSSFFDLVLTKKSSFFSCKNKPFFKLYVNIWNSKRYLCKKMSYFLNKTMRMVNIYNFGDDFIIFNQLIIRFINLELFHPF